MKTGDAQSGEPSKTEIGIAAQTGEFRQEDVDAIIRRLTPARRNMIVNGDLGYGDCNHTMDGPGRRMLYALIDLGLFQSPDRLKTHTSASYVLSDLGWAARRRLKDMEKSRRP